MSVNEHVFLESGLPLDVAAQRLSTALGIKIRFTKPDAIALQGEDFMGSPGVTNGSLTNNYFSGNDVYPDEVAAYDGCDVVLNLWRPDKNIELQQLSARAVLDAVAERLGWRTVLIHNLSFLVASWDKERGLREYPEATTPDAQDRAVWTG